MVLVFNYSKKDPTAKRNLKTYFSLKVSNPEAFFKTIFEFILVNLQASTKYSLTSDVLHKN